MVYRVFVEKREGYRAEADALKAEATGILGVKNLTGVRVINRYDAEFITPELFREVTDTVFSEPQVDEASDELDARGGYAFAVEYLAGQFDQRADSAAQCIQIISQGDRPLIRTAKVYVLCGDLTAEEIETIKKHVINPVEAHETGMEKPQTLKANYAIPTTVKTLDGFINLSRAELDQFVRDYSLAMDGDDIAFCQAYFRSERRDPTITEIRMIDTYWSDHCRHTTFLTIIDDAKFEDEELQKAYDDYLTVRGDLNRKKPICLMDLATIGAKYLKACGKLDKLDESEEINACTVKTTVTVNGKPEPWLLLFKNETHNHPTEIEPFGGAATCIGGAIRDPLSGRAYVYGAMRVTGAADPTVPVSETIKGKLPQRKIVTGAAAGYSSYGNQIGLATGVVDEIYHDGYAAKRMEIGAVIAAAPAANVRREVPAPGDVVILLGGSTGRDGCGGATGSSKSHTVSSIETCGAEVQKGNAPEERKLQRLFRLPEASRLIKRCNDFGAGGVSVAIGELADGLDIDLNAVPRKYDGLDGTELAISESQERMAVVVDPADADEFLALAAKENLQAKIVARVKAEPRLTMVWNGKKIVDISREFLNSNGAEKHVKAREEKEKPIVKEIPADFAKGYEQLVSDLNVCSKRGLSERFDSTIGAGSVLMPFGGKYQLTPVQAMVQKISLEKGETDDVSFMSWGYDPFVTSLSPFKGAYLSVVSSLCKLVATGAKFEDVYLTFQEYFERLGKDEKKWGKPLSALLGALEAQLDYSVAAIGGKDSMSGTFENISVPPTLVSFAVTTGKVSDAVSPEFKTAGDDVYLLSPALKENGLPDPQSQIALFSRITGLMREGKIVAAYAVSHGGVAEAVYKMAIGNGFGFDYEKSASNDALFGYKYGSFVVETTGKIDGTLLGKVTSDGYISRGDEKVALSVLGEKYENRLESVYNCNIKQNCGKIETLTYGFDGKRVAPAVKCARPRFLIPAFPGTNCEYDSAKAVERAGAESRIFVINNLSADGIRRSAEEFAKEIAKSQVVFIPGGFSGGDEPDGSGKFITAFFRSPAVRAETEKLLSSRDGLMLGICNGFQALVKLGLVPYGRIVDDVLPSSPTLTFNEIGRHQSKIVRIRVASDKSPWLSLTREGDIYSVPVSHGEGRFIAGSELQNLIAGGQIATQYVDLDGNATDDVRFNPNGSDYAIEGITSPDGRVFGKMGHSERIGAGLYKNVVGEYDMKLFASAVKYFKG